MCKEKGCNINNAPKIRNYKMPKFQTIYGYMFDCHRFLYNNRKRKIIRRIAAT